MRTEIRPLQPPDKAPLSSLLRAMPEFSPADLSVAEELIESCLKDPATSGYHIFVAGPNGSVDGYICYGPTPLTQGTWDIYWIAVRPGSQGQGLGGALLSFAEDNILEARGRLVLIETSGRPEYEKARRFYLKSGYMIVCELADFYAPGDSRIILQKRLPQDSEPSGRKG
jgi:ribosomal protein S18 acetylase RimI-like enzyme